MLSNLGWRAGQPWLQEVVVPNNLPWGETGLDKQKSVREWKRLGVTPREGRLGDASLPGLNHSSSGAQRTRVHRIPEFSGLF